MGEQPGELLDRMLEILPVIFVEISAAEKETRMRRKRFQSFRTVAADQEAGAEVMQFLELLESHKILPAIVFALLTMVR